MHSREAPQSHWVRVAIPSDHPGSNRLEHSYVNAGNDGNKVDKVDAQFRRVLRPNVDGGVDFATTDALWSVGAEGPPVRVYEHFAPYVDRDVLDQALAYAERFGAEIESAIEQNERLERLVSGER